MGFGLHASVICTREPTVHMHHLPGLTAINAVHTKCAFASSLFSSPFIQIKSQLRVCRGRRNRKLLVSCNHLSTTSIGDNGGKEAIIDLAPSTDKMGSSTDKSTILPSSGVSGWSTTDLEDEIGELDSSTHPNHRSGYVAVLGKPNVGKSTLVNQMIGQKLSIVTEKPQTTRHRILGLCSDKEYQIILYDTPGVIEKKMHKLDSMMMKNVRSAMFDADCVLVLVDASKTPENIDDMLQEGVGNLKDTLPTLLVLNKKDLVKPGELTRKTEWYEKFSNADDVIPVSAKLGHGVVDVKDWILSKLPYGPAFYPKDIASEHPERFFVGEIVREKIMMQYRNELPYACQVNVVEYISRPTAKDFIKVDIIVERNSQKTILIGKGGKALKMLASAARVDMEEFLQKKVYLEIEVKVQEKWCQDEGILKSYGYGGHIRVM